MASATKTKPTHKPAASPPATTKAKATKADAAPKSGKKAAKATADAAKNKAPAVILEAESFAKFTGYRTNVPKDEAVFKADDVLFILGSATDDNGKVTYTAINAKDIATYEEHGEEAVVGGEVASNEVAEIKGAALEKVKEQYVPVIVFGKLSELLDANDDDAIEVARELSNQIQANYFWLGGALAKVFQAGTYLKSNGGKYTGENAFHDFCQAEFGFSGSKGRQLARIYTTFSAMEGFDPEDQLAGMDWSKVAIAERFVTPDNVNEVLKLVDKTSQRDLAVTLKQKFAAGDGKTVSGKAASRGPSIQKKTLTFKLDEDAAETVELVLQQAVKQFGIPEAAALERIMVMWAEDNVDGDAAKKRIAAKAKAAEKARAEAAKAAAPATATADAKAKPTTKPAIKKK